MTPPSKDIKAPASEPSIEVTNSSPSEEVRTPEQRPRKDDPKQRPRKEDSDSQPKVTIFHTDRQTDRHIYRLCQWLLDNFSITTERQSEMKEAN